ncbi:hypothetical protein [Streptomyces chromofuscus]|uniref:Uncharacterized protein n=1 Tax=Streptomyces chromofuscus TaxID=42881 RepID=A0A7M2TCM1_STRCW|nr:hypothetical protein [Streptomyces chromofuscus]QOV45889.1 hypothetical protein IPT68_08255 [Streptomyces chromofuscus]GGT39642.1 hypothetical protein GCM10010254_69580 [Streptomyces chromofuscus]
MPASTHTPPRSATTGRVDMRLPWWALALPALAFVALLTLMLNPADAHAASGEPAIAHLVERAHQLISR